MVYNSVARFTDSGMVSLDKSAAAHDLLLNHPQTDANTQTQLAGSYKQPVKENTPFRSYIPFRDAGKCEKQPGDTPSSGPAQLHAESKAESKAALSPRLCVRPEGSDPKTVAPFRRSIPRGSQRGGPFGVRELGVGWIPIQEPVQIQFQLPIQTTK